MSGSCSTRCSGIRPSFARWDEVERGWEIVDELLQRWGTTAIAASNYAAGTWGPPEADALIRRDGREWRRL